MPTIRTFIVEDSPIIRENLVATLQEMSDIEVVGYAEDEVTAVRWLTEPDNQCQLGIVDIVLKNGSGLGVLEAIRKSGRALRLVVLSNYATPSVRARCLALGADKVFDKSNELESLIAYCMEMADAGS